MTDPKIELAKSLSGLLPGGKTLRTDFPELNEDLDRIGSAMLDVLKIAGEVFGARENSGIPLTTSERLGIIRDRIETEFPAGDLSDPIETIFVFITPHERIRQLLNQGRAKFREAAREALSIFHPVQHSRMLSIIASFYFSLIHFDCIRLKNGKPLRPKGNFKK
jgi:hypothetical protein